MENININHIEDDYMVHAIAKKGLLRCLAVRTTGLVEEAQKIHDLSPASTIAMGRLLSGALLMSADLKNKKNQLTLNIKSDGDISNLTVVSNVDGQVRAYINNPHAPAYYHHPGKFDIGKSIGKGNLTVIKDLGLKKPYVGTVELLSGEIAEDLASYYFYSEQIPTVLFLGVKLNPSGLLAAGGMLIQALPGADDDLLDWLETRTKGFPDISELIESKISPHQLIDMILGNTDLEYLRENKVSYHCPCNRDRMQRNLISLGTEDLSDLAKDEAGINLHCHFCGADYHFSQEEIIKMLE